MRSPRSIVPRRLASILLACPACSALVLALLFAAPATASAQTIPSPYRFIDTNHEGGLFAGTVRPDRGTFGFGPGDGTIFGARYAIQLAGPFSIEGLVSGMPATRDVVDPTVAAGDRVIGDADVFLGALEGRLKFSLMGNRTWNRLSPHVVLGGGGVFDLAGEQEADLALPRDQRFTFDTSFLATLGGGARWLPTDRLSLRAEALLKLWKINTPPGYTILEEEIGAVEQSQWVRSPTFTFGASIRF